MNPFTHVRSVPLLVLLVLLAASLPPTSSQEEPDGPHGVGTLVVEDPLADAGPLGIGTGDPTLNQPFQHIDITEVKLGPETADELPISISFAGFDPTLSRAMMAASLRRVDCTMDWTYNGNGDTRYRFDFWTDELVPGESPAFLADLTFDFWDGEDYNYDYTQTAFSYAYDTETNTFTAVFPKNVIPVFPGGAGPSRGDFMEIRRIFCATDTAGYVTHSDQLDTSPLRFGFAAPGSGDVVQVSIGAGSSSTSPYAKDFEFPEEGSSGPVVAVTLEGTSLVPVRLQNLQSEKKLVLLTASVAADAPAGWNLSIAPSVFVKAHENRMVNMIVTPPQDARFGDEVRVEVRAEVAAESSVGLAEVGVQVAPLIGADQNVLRFHARETSTSPQDTALGRRDYEFKVSLLERLDGWEETMVAPGIASSTSSSPTFDGFGRPVRLPADANATVDFTITGDTGITLNLYMWDEEGLVFSMWDWYEAGTHTVLLPLLIDEERIYQAGDAWTFYVYVGQDVVPTESALDLSTMRLTLPLEQSQTGLSVTDGRFLPNLALADDADRVNYVNPGQGHVFDLNLSNDGVEDDELRVTAEVENATGWRVEILPGARFAVPAGASTPVSIRLAAPADAAEGDFAEVLVKATSENDPKAYASMRLKAIATNTEFEEKGYVEKEDQLKPLADERDSPAPVALVALTFLLGLLRARRRVA